MGDLAAYESDPRLFLFTSLTAGSSHIITATSRMETILKANKLPFQAVDLATDPTARSLWQRRARGKKLPGLVKDGFVVGDLEEVEEWNEFGELKENIGPLPASNAAPAAGAVQGVNIRPAEPKSPQQQQQQVVPPAPKPGVNKAPAPLLDESKRVALPGAAEIAARNKKAQDETSTTASPVVDEKPAAAETMNAAPEEKEESINAAKAILKENENPKVEHLSAPPSAVASGTATPEPEKEAEEKTEGEDVEGSQAELKDEVAESGSKDTTGGEENDEVPPAARKHRGSEVKDVPIDEIRRIEKENALKEEKGESGDEASKAVEELKVTDLDEGEKKDDGEERTQDQDAKAPEEAPKSVED